MSALRGHVAVVTGGLGDIGRAFALELSRLGADARAVRRWVAAVERSLGLPTLVIPNAPAAARVVIPSRVSGANPLNSMRGIAIVSPPFGALGESRRSRVT